jgi:hypothetical protein
MAALAALAVRALVVERLAARLAAAQLHSVVAVAVGVLQAAPALQAATAKPAW